MTDTLIALMSILIGIIGANLMGFLYKKYSFGLTGNTIAGVFGSILCIKSFGRLGFDPISIMETGNTNWLLFCLNCVVSFLGGVVAIVLLKEFKRVMDTKKII